MMEYPKCQKILVHNQREVSILSSSQVVISKTPMRPDKIATNIELVRGGNVVNFGLN